MKDGRMEGWKNGKMEDWNKGKMDEYIFNGKYLSE